ncbi:hypothetical protein Y956_10107, partial [Nipponia nippon]
ITALEFKRPNFGLFKDLPGGIPWVRALEGRGVQESWLIVKHHFLQAQDRCIPMSKKSSKEGRRPAWMSKELPAKLKWKKEVYRMCKKRQTTWEEYGNVVRVCRDAVRKAKVHLELNLARDVKDKKGFFKYINQKRKVKESVPPLMSSSGELITTDEEKAEVLNNFFASVFTGNLSPHTSRVNGPFDGDWEGRGPSTVRENQV